MGPIRTSPLLHLPADVSQVELARPSNGRIVVAGDWHGNLSCASYVLHQAVNRGVDVVVQLGDFGLWPGAGGRTYLEQLEALASNLGVHVFWLDGNHEDFDQLVQFEMRTTGLRTLSPHVTHVSRGARWVWGAVRFVAIGGATSLDRPQRIAGSSWWPQEEITGPQAADIAAGGVADVVFSHDVTSDVHVPGINHRVYTTMWSARELERAWVHRERLGEITRAVQPTHLFHGHFHVAYQKQVQLPWGQVNVTGLGADDDVEQNYIEVELNDLAAEVQHLRSTSS